ncbi:type VI secretion system baseplate subunit TssK [Thalassococcus sp. S3]|uniref:type VI secretion system baseplate subunit TssK n=1 Tax=Thalassococcus sp. S3 TaxID=2017482 RepID=UPI0010245633|nr:type VI secretion system baseplate subunit TssK [Thalassococcus sp. S3]QBF33979.1 type VI secretion system-associated protein [Thalassococcus sp. S3]
MSWDNRVVWSEGLFLRPQHLQQADRYAERFARDMTSALRGDAWGITELTLNQEMLKLGKIGIETAAGIMEDGTPFAIPEDADPPVPYCPPEHLKNETVHLCLPLRQPGMPDIDTRSDPDLPLRYGISDEALIDVASTERDSAEIEIARLQFRILPDSAERDGFVCLPLTRVTEARANKTLVLDKGHVPPVLDCQASAVLTGYVTEIAGLLHHRAEALGGRVAASGTRGVAEIADFLLLQVVNRYTPVFDHFGTVSRLHPERLYIVMAQLAGELATYAQANKRSPKLTQYDHADLAASFQPVIASIRTSLNAVLDQSALSIPLREHKYGVHLAEVTDRKLFAQATFVLAVKADVPTERLRRDFPAQVKIGPAERIKELVNVALPGISVDPLPVAPRQIPFHVSTSYFEIDQKSPHWKDMRHSGGLAMHVSGEFPGLEIALWAIRGQ